MSMHLLKPVIHRPASSLITPPQPAKLGLPLDEPSVLSFIQPCGSLSHRIICITLRVSRLGEDTQWMNSRAWFTISTSSFRFLLFRLKTKLFLLFQIFQIAIGKTTLQGKCTARKLQLTLPLKDIQSPTSCFSKMLWFEDKIPNWFHICLNGGQSLRACGMLSSPSWLMGHIVSWITPILSRKTLTPMLGTFPKKSLYFRECIRFPYPASRERDNVVTGIAWIVLFISKGSSKRISSQS